MEGVTRMEDEEFGEVYTASFELIGVAGDSKAESMSAIESCKQGDFEAARQHLKAADELMLKAHDSQTSMLQQEALGSHVETNIMLVHAQDHLTMATVARDMAEQLLDLYERIDALTPGDSKLCRQ